MRVTQEQKCQAVALFENVQKRLTQALTEVDGQAPSGFQFKPWSKDESVPSGSDTLDLNAACRGQAGGGRMAVLRSQVVEKSGVNVSAVSGEKYPALEGNLKDQPFFAAGVSTICHMYNPHAPIAHMNVRLLEVGDEFWVGGGADLTPCIEYADDTKDFHHALAQACERFEAGSYERFKKWCDEYFYIPHRQSSRGVGGVFFDYLKGDFDKLLRFLDDITTAYIDVYPAILKRRKDIPFSEAEKEKQLFWRGRYAEFNLVYDRGTKFGLMTGGNIEAIFVSLPPLVKW